MICDGVNGYLFCFVLTTSYISWENREMQSSTLPGKNLFMETLQQKVKKKKHFWLEFFFY